MPRAPLWGLRAKWLDGALTPVQSHKSDIGSGTPRLTIQGHCPAQYVPPKPSLGERDSLSKEKGRQPVSCRPLFG